MTETGRHHIGILGAGGIVRTAHLPAYRALGLPVTAWSRSEQSRELLASESVTPQAPKLTIVPRAADILADDRIDIVDIATPPGPRLDLLEQAIAAGKHVLLQKPAVDTASDIPRLAQLAARAQACGLRVAVNQNARWAPAWRATTDLIRQGLIGEVIGVTHLHDKPLPPLTGTPFDLIDQMLLVDYLNHWFDITTSWLAPASPEQICATSSRTPGQPQAARNPWQATAHMMFTTGASATLRIVGNAATEGGGCPFWVHGTTGTIRGSILRGSDRVTLENGDGIREVSLHGEWFVDGFIGTMSELLSAIDCNREPEHNIASVLPGLQSAFAAAASASAGGVPIEVSK